MSIEEIIEGLPHLTAAQVHHALSYYHDHREEIEKDIEENRIEKLMEKYGLKRDEEDRLPSKDNKK